MSNSFISPRRSRSRRDGWKTRGAGEPTIVKAKHTTKCPVCQKLMVEGRDFVALCFKTQEWVHAGECLERASYGSKIE